MVSLGKRELVDVESDLQSSSVVNGHYCFTLYISYLQALVTPSILPIGSWEGRGLFSYVQDILGNSGGHSSVNSIVIHIEDVLASASNKPLSKVRASNVYCDTSHLQFYKQE